VDEEEFLQITAKVVFTDNDESRLYMLNISRAGANNADDCGEGSRNQTSSK
jgi:hypothetical protein